MLAVVKDSPIFASHFGENCVLLLTKMLERIHEVDASSSGANLVLVEGQHARPLKVCELSLAFSSFRAI